jgi:hypothetical protein
MAPNANGRTSPTSVVEITPIVTIGVRDYDLDMTIEMFRSHMEDNYAMTGTRVYWVSTIFQRLDLIRAGCTVVWIPDCNTGEWLDVEEWFIRYGFAPDMVIPGAYIDNEAEVLVLDETPVDLSIFDEYTTANDDDGTETTASVTLGSQDTEVSELTADDKWEDIKKNGFKTELARPITDEDFEIDLESIDSWELKMQTSNNNRG